MKRIVLLIVCIATLWSPAYGQDAPDAIESKRQADAELDSAVRIAIERLRESEPEELGEFRALETRYEAITKEIRYIRGKIAHAKKKLIGAEATGNDSYITKWTAEVKAWEGRLEHAEQELARVESGLGGLAEDIKNAVTTDDTSDVILPGETVEVFVAEDELFNGLYQVRRGGYIIVPQIGRINLAGKDQESAENAIKQALEQNQLREATVMVERTERLAPRDERGLIYLVGEFLPFPSLGIPSRLGISGFQVPGAQYLPKGTPSVVSLVLSYRTTPYADLEHVKLLRLVTGRGLLEEVNVQSVLKGNELASDIPLQEGDIIIVPRKGDTNRVYVTGRVKNEQILPIPADEELTAYKAVLRCDGFDRFANIKKVYVLRELGSGQKTRIPVNIKDVQKGRIPDLVLQANDIVVVPEKFFSF